MSIWNLKAVLTMYPDNLADRWLRHETCTCYLKISEWRSGDKLETFCRVSPVSPTCVTGDRLLRRKITFPYTCKSKIQVPFSHMLPTSFLFPHKKPFLGYKKPLSMIKSPFKKLFITALYGRERQATDSKKLSQLLRASRVQWRDCRRRTNLHIGGIL